MAVLHETCQQYVARRLSEGWKIVSQKGFNVVLQSPEGIIRPVDLRNDVETLRPNAAGDECSIDSYLGGGNCGACPNHWGCVDEERADDTSLVRTQSLTYLRDLFNLPASSGSGIINFIKIYFRVLGAGGYGHAKPALKSNSTPTDGTEVDLTSAFVTHSQQWDVNPADGEDWEWDDIDSLQIGISLQAEFEEMTYCSQIYVEIDYVGVSAPTVTTQAVSNIGTITATGNGTITDNGGATATRGMCWNTTGNPTTADSHATNGTGEGAYTVPITGLSPGQKYYVKAYSVNSAGTGYGAQVEFRATYDELNKLQVILATIGEADAQQMIEPPKEQAILTILSETDGFIFFELNREQVVLATIDRVDNYIANEFNKEQIILGVMSEADILLMKELLKEQVILAVLTEVNSHIANELGKEQQVIAILSRTDALSMGETNKLQTILAALSEVDRLSMSEVGKLQVILALLTEQGWGMRARKRMPQSAVRNLLAARNLPPV